MVDIMGHVAMGLLWAVPAWFFWEDRIHLAFIGLTGVTALLPDIDLWLDKVVPSLVHHHGVTHTVVFVLAVSVLAGVIAAATLTKPVNRWLGRHQVDAGSLFMFTAGAFLLGGLSHLFMDILSAPDLAQPIEPFWPLFDKPWALDVIWYTSPLWNLGLLTVAVLLHLTIGYVAEPFEHPYRLNRH